MAKLTTAKRNPLPKDFAGPDRSFPVEDKAPPVAAKRLVGRALKSGFVTPAQADTIREKAKRSSPPFETTPLGRMAWRRPDSVPDMTASPGSVRLVRST
jgi:hypothetical protein